MRRGVLQVYFLPETLCLHWEAEVAEDLVRLEQRVVRVAVAEVQIPPHRAALAVQERLGKDSQEAIPQ
jgi:hypothetical protein